MRTTTAQGFLRHGLVAVFTCVFFCAGLGAEPPASGDQPVLAILLSRHGVRAPLSSNAAMAKYASQPWPVWEVEPGIQTPRGNLLVALMGDYYKARFVRDGFLTGNAETDAPLMFVRADNDQRTLETARILSKSLVPSVAPDIHALDPEAKDSLFRPYAAHVGHPDLALAAASVLGRLGGDPSLAERAYATPLARLRGILNGPGEDHPLASFDEPTRVSPGNKDYPVDIVGRLQTGMLATESLVLEYADGKPAADVGWGRVDERGLTDLLAVHAFYFDLTQRTRYLAQINASNLASHILDTLEQGALAQPVPGALGAPGERLVVLVGHDSNIEALGGLLGLNWWLAGTQADPVLPGGALLFELWRRPGQPDSYRIRVSYLSQTLAQLHSAQTLSLETPPGISPIFVPGCSGPTPGFDAPLDNFVRQARRAIDPAFVAEER